MKNQVSELSLGYINNGRETLKWIKDPFNLVDNASSKAENLSSSANASASAR